MTIQSIGWSMGTKPFSPEDNISLENSLKPIENAYLGPNGEVNKRPGFNLAYSIDTNENRVIGFYYWQEKELYIVILKDSSVFYSDTSTINFVEMAYHTAKPAFGWTLSNERTVSFATNGETLFFCAESVIYFFAPGRSADSTFTAADYNTTLFHLQPYFSALGCSAPYKGAEYIYKELIYFNNKFLFFATDNATFPTTKNKIYYTLSGDPLEVDSTPTNINWNYDNFMAETLPDDTIGIKSARREIFVQGKNSIEVWYDSGAYPAPFKRLSNLVIEYGVLSSETFIDANTTWYWVAPDKRIMMMQGRKPTVISTPIQSELNRLEYPERSRADKIEFDGNPFIIFSFVEDKKYFVYNYATNVWSKWSYYEEEYWFNNIIHISKINMVLASSAKYGCIYILNKDIYQDYSVLFDPNGSKKPIKVKFETGWQNHGTDERKSCRFLHIRIKSGEKAAKKILLSWRNEGIDQWTSRIIDLPPLGDYGSIVRVNNLGLYRYRQWKIEQMENSDFILVSVKEGVELLK